MDYAEWCARRNRPAFMSLYQFRKADLSAKKVDRDSAIVDRIKFDIDGSSHASGNDDAQAELHRLMDWMDDRGMDYEINFSGSDGFGVLVPFPEAKVTNAYNVVRRMYERFAELTNVAIDSGAMNGTQQKFRIVNSLHQRSKRYAVPITKEEARTLSMKEIKRLAGAPREQVEFADPHNNLVLHEAARKIDDHDYQSNVSGGGGKPAERYDGFRGKQPLRPCTRFIMERKIRGWIPMSIVAFELVAVGWTDEQIHDWSKSIGSGKYDARTTQYHIDQIRSKMERGDLFMHGCGSIKRHGFCVYENAFDESECADAEREAEKLALLQKIREAREEATEASGSIADF